jgi:hypothetical protein
LSRTAAPKPMKYNAPNPTSAMNQSILVVFIDISPVAPGPCPHHPRTPRQLRQPRVFPRAVIPPADDGSEVLHPHLPPKVLPAVRAHSVHDRAECGCRLL